MKLNEEMVNRETVTNSSGNVFQDLGIPDADDQLIKSNLAICILKEIRQRGLTQTAAAKRIGIPQPKLSLIMRGILDEFSIERLIRYSNSLDIGVKIETYKRKEAKATDKKPAKTSRQAKAAAAG